MVIQTGGHLRRFVFNLRVSFSVRSDFIIKWLVSGPDSNQIRTTLGIINSVTCLQCLTLLLFWLFRF